MRQAFWVILDLDTAIAVNHPMPELTAILQELNNSLGFHYYLLSFLFTGAICRARPA